MIYPYYCDVCQSMAVDVWKPVCEASKIEHCQDCDKILRRVYTTTNLINTAVQESYYHTGLGQVVKGDTHAKKVAKERGLIEVGNEKPQKHVKPKESDWDIKPEDIHEVTRINAKS